PACLPRRGSHRSCGPRPPGRAPSRGTHRVTEADAGVPRVPLPGAMTLPSTPPAGAGSGARAGGPIAWRGWRRCAPIRAGEVVGRPTRLDLAEGPARLVEESLLPIRLAHQGALAHEIERALELFHRELVELGVDRPRRAERLGECN